MDDGKKKHTHTTIHIVIRIGIHPLKKCKSPFDVLKLCSAFCEDRALSSDKSNPMQTCVKNALQAAFVFVMTEGVVMICSVCHGNVAVRLC